MNISENSELSGDMMENFAIAGETSKFSSHRAHFRCLQIVNLHCKGIGYVFNPLLALMPAPVK